MVFSKHILSISIIFHLFGISACAQKKPLLKSTENKVLIVYVSRTNNTKTVAEIIQKKLGGTLKALELINPYPENYQEIVAQVDRENEEGFLPELKTKIEIWEEYDTVFIGFPKSIMGLQTLLSVLEERKATGITDNWGKEASHNSNTNPKYERSKKVLEELIQNPLPETKPDYQQFSPEIDTFLKEHLCRYI